MKRSEMKKHIFEVIYNHKQKCAEHGPISPIEDMILDRIEALGMLPPSQLKTIHVDPKKLTIWQWESENEA